MKYDSWKNQVYALIDFRTKNFIVSESEKELLVGLVYHELMNELNLTYLAQRVEATDKGEYIFDSLPQRYFPDLYIDSEKIEVVDIVCLDGTSAVRYVDKVCDNTYQVNDRIKIEHSIMMEDEEFLNGCFQEDNYKDLIFWWKIIPAINELDERIYDIILPATLQGLAFYIESSIPSQVDSGVSNLSYQRWYNEKQKLINKYPTMPSYERHKLIWTEYCGETVTSCYGEDYDCKCQLFIPDCSDKLITLFGYEFNVSCYYHGQCDLPNTEPDIKFGYVWDTCMPFEGCFYLNVVDKETQEMDVFVTVDGSKFSVGMIHGGCGKALPEFGLTCMPGVDCPSCVEFKSYDGYSLFDTFKPENSDRLMVGYEYGSCVRPCLYFKSSNPDTGMHDYFVPKLSDGYLVGDKYGCTTDPIEKPDFGLTCMPNIDCPDCIRFMVMDKNGIFSLFVPRSSESLMVGWEHDGCGSGITPPELEYGLTCTPNMNCPDCIVLRSYDGLDGFDIFSPSDNDRFTIGWKHDGCGDGSGDIPGYGYTCIPGMDCPDCIIFNQYNGDSTFGKYIPSQSDTLRIGYEHGKCSPDVPSNDPDYGLTCIPGMDCPDCIIFKSSDGYDTQGNKIFLTFIAYDSRLLVGGEHGSCKSADIIPGKPTDVTASTGERGRVLLEWKRPEYGSPEPTYNIERDGSIVASNISNLWYQDEVPAGTYSYRIEAVNSVGSAFSDTVSGSAVSASEVPNSPTAFNASRDREGQILVTFNESTSGIPAPTYNLYSGGSEVATNIVSGYLWTVNPGTYDMYVRAINSEGFADSNMSEGKSLTIHSAFYTVRAKLFIVVPGDILTVQD